MTKWNDQCFRFSFFFNLTDLGIQGFNRRISKNLDLETLLALCCRKSCLNKQWLCQDLRSTG
uniref:Uncharacterized protein n=1 Tax=Anguilla anguilla TaxID=7936 RepID=A0A0E9WZP4_ANGAN